MARRATKDTFGFERTGLLPGDETEVRRQVVAGQMIPEGYRVEDSSAFEEVEGSPTVGLGAAPAAYKHQLDDNGRVREEHLEASQRQAGAKRKDSGQRVANPEGEE